MVILSIDLGKKCGISVNADNWLHLEEYEFEDYEKFYNKIRDLILLYKPILIIIPYPTRFYNVILSHAKLMGIICLLGEKNNLTVLEVQDATCKKVVFGKGKVKKEEIMEHYKQESEHIADSMMFVDYYKISIDN